MICMIPKVNLGVWYMAFMFGDLHVSLKQAFIGGLFDAFAYCLASFLFRLRSKDGT